MLMWGISAALGLRGRLNGGGNPGGGGGCVKRGLQERGWEDLGSGAPLGGFYFRPSSMPFHSASLIILVFMV